MVPSDPEAMTRLTVGPVLCANVTHVFIKSLSFTYLEVSFAD